MINVIDLFSGAGGLTFGFQKKLKIMFLFLEKILIFDLLMSLILMLLKHLDKIIQRLP